MNWFTAVILFVLIWWTVLFAVLPFGVKPLADADERTGWRGAPANPMLGRKIIATTLVSLVLWAGGMAVIHSDWGSFRAAALKMPDN
jgi:predicted secreted protein